LAFRVIFFFRVEVWKEEIFLTRSVSGVKIRRRQSPEGARLKSWNKLRVIPEFPWILYDLWRQVRMLDAIQHLHLMSCKHKIVVPHRGPPPPPHALHIHPPPSSSPFTTTILHNVSLSLSHSHRRGDGLFPVL
jgi:hypothetical protein